MLKHLVAVALLIAAAASGAPAQESDRGGRPPESSARASAEVVKRGAPIGDSERVKFAEVLKEPGKYAGKRVVIEGVVNRVCKKEGCWMEISPEGAADAPAVRVTFGDHAFFVPKDSTHTRFRAEGVFSLKTLSKEQVEHLVKDDGAKIKTNPDGTADEVAFNASGVELWK
jgi:hypothetical protein